MVGYTFVVIMVSLRVKIPHFDPQTHHDDYKRVPSHFLAPPLTLFHSAKIYRGVTKCTIPLKNEEFRPGYLYKQTLNANIS